MNCMDLFCLRRLFDLLGAVESSSELTLTNGSLKSLRNQNTRMCVLAGTSMANISWSTSMYDNFAAISSILRVSLMLEFFLLGFSIY